MSVDSIKDDEVPAEDNAAEAGKKAIEASKINEKEKPASQMEEDEKKDAEVWRNEG